MKKNQKALLAVLILTGVALYLYFNNKTSTIKEELRDFAVEDTASITKIFLADKEGHQVTLEKLEPGKWMVNKKHEARNDAIENLLLTVGQIDVKAPVAKAAMDNVIKVMATQSTKVEIYQGEDEPSKVYYVGHATQDNFGTHMLLENSSVPFVMHIKGFMGYLSSRYFCEEDKWRQTKLFGYSMDDLGSVEVNYPSRPERSFIIENIDNEKLSIKSLSDNKILANMDTLSVFAYLQLYQKVHFEYFANEVKQHVRDSLAQNGPLFSITVTDVLGNKNMVKAYRKPTKAGSTDLDGNMVNFDIDRMCAYIHDDKEFVIIQYAVFDFLTIPYEALLLKSN